MTRMRPMLEREGSGPERSGKTTRAMKARVTKPTHKRRGGDGASMGEFLGMAEF